MCFCIVSLSLSWITVGAVRTTESNSDSIKDKVSPILAPAYFFSSGISSVWAKVAHVGAVFTTIWQKPVEKDKLQELENQVQLLKHQLAMERDANKRRLEELHEICTNLAGDATESELPFQLLPAKVIAVEPTDWFRYVTINKGRADHVGTDMAIITPSRPADDVEELTGAVVGKVVSVQEHSSRIQLITDRMSVVAVTIGDQGDMALMDGQPESENCIIDAVPSTTHDMLKKGHAVLVDERSTIFPPGMLVGHISSIEKGTHFCRIEVQPAFKFGKLREVMVVLGTGY